MPVSAHPLEARLLAWRETQEAMKMESLRRAYGMAEPIRRGMELKIVRDASFTPMALGGPRANGGNLHEDILVLGGRDTEIGWEDVFHGNFIFFPFSFPFILFSEETLGLVCGRGYKLLIQIYR